MSADFPPPHGGNCSFSASHLLWFLAKANPGAAGFLFGIQAGAFPLSQEKPNPPSTPVIRAELQIAQTRQKIELLTTSGC